MGKDKNKKNHKGNVTKITKSYLRGYNKQSHIDIPNSITEIGEDTFLFFKLTSVTIPSSVTTIGNSAFKYCGNLNSVDIPNSVQI